MLQSTNELQIEEEDLPEWHRDKLNFKAVKRPKISDKWSAEKKQKAINSFCESVLRANGLKRPERPKDLADIESFKCEEGICNYAQRFVFDMRFCRKRKRAKRIAVDDYMVNGKLKRCVRKVYALHPARIAKIAHLPRYVRWKAKQKHRKIRMEMKSKIPKICESQDKLNESLQNIQDFMDRMPNFTNSKNRYKAKELQSKLLKASESQVSFLRELLTTIKDMRDIEDKKELYHARNNRGLLMKILYFQAQALPLWISTIKEPYAPKGVGACSLDESYFPKEGEVCAAFYNETWILAQIVHVHPGCGKYELRDVDSKSKRRGAGLVGGVKAVIGKRKKKTKIVHPKKAVAERFEILADYKKSHKLTPEEFEDVTDLTEVSEEVEVANKKIRLKENVNLNDQDTYWDDWDKVIEPGQNDLDSTPLARQEPYIFNVTVDEPPEKKKKGGFAVFRKRIIPLPRYRADPQRDPHALFPAEAIVLALYPQTTCFYKGVVIRPPQTATDDYMISFEDKVYASGWSPASRVPQKYVVTYKEIKTHKKKLNIFDEGPDD